MTRAAVALALVLLGCPGGAAAASAELAAGIRLVKDGDFEQGLVALDAAARILAALPHADRELAQAYLYLGVAYVGLGQEPLAESKFRQALQRDPSLRLTAEEFPSRVIRTFERTRQALISATTLEKEAKKSKGKGPLILLGAGGAAAAVVAVALGGERENRPPTASLTIRPEGAVIEEVTTVRFTATAEDPEGQPLSLSWNFGDGESASGAAVSHVYRRSGTFAVTLTVSDAAQSVSARGTVTVRSLDGTWRVAGEAFRGVREMQIRQETCCGGRLFATIVLASGDSLTCTDGVATDPRNVSLGFSDCRRNFSASACCPCRFTLTGEVDSALDRISGTLSCSCTREWDFCDGQQPITIVR